MTSPNQLTELSKPVTRGVYFLELQFGSGTARLSSANFPISWGDQALYLGAISTPPSLAFNFIESPSLTPKIGAATLGFTRSGANATRVNELGLIETMAADQPRFDYDPITLQCKGLLVEEAATNLQLWSEDFTNAAHTKRDCNVTANATIAPDGNLTADLLTQTGGGISYKGAYGGGYTLTAGATYVLTRFVKQQVGVRYVSLDVHDLNFTYAAVDFDLQAVGGDPRYQAGGNTNSRAVAGSARFIPMGNGWFKLSASFLISANGTYYGLLCMLDPARDISAAVYTGDGVSGIYAWGAGIVTGADMSSYIATTSATVTRNGDIPRVASLGAWFSTIQGTGFVEALPSSDPNGYIWSFNDGGGNNRIGSIRVSTTTIESFVVQTAFQFQTGNVGTADFTMFRDVMVWQNNDFAAVLNGGAVFTDSLGTIPTVTQLDIGHSLGSGFNGHIRRFVYYNTRLSNADLITLTAPGPSPFAQVWSGLGEVGGISPVEESDGVESRGVTFQLNVSNPTWLALAVGPVEDYRGKPAKMYFCPLDENFQLVDSPEICWRGVMDLVSVNVEGEDGAGKITLKCETSAFNLKRRSGLRLNSAQQKKKYPTDTGLDYITDLIANPQIWLSKLFQKQ